jgi:protein SCO1
LTKPSASQAPPGEPGQTPPGESGTASKGQQPGQKPTRRGGPARLILISGLITVLFIAAVVSSVYLVTRRDQTSAANNPPRPSGIPASISTSLANLMSLSPLPRTAAPGFTLTDQAGRTLNMSSLRGKIVVLEFMDPHCTDICPIVSNEFVRAYHDLGPLASKVVFAAVNVNQYYATVNDVAMFSRGQQLTAIPSWHFFTGPVPALREVWSSYHIAVQAPNPNADIVHTSAVYFIDPQGRERYLAEPMVDHSKSGTAFLPPDQIASWGRGIALVARDMAR